MIQPGWFARQHGGVVVGIGAIPCAVGVSGSVRWLVLIQASAKGSSIQCTGVRNREMWQAECLLAWLAVWALMQVPF
jgi:hypothetical protein